MALVTTLPALPAVGLWYPALLLARFVYAALLVGFVVWIRNRMAGVRTVW